MNLILLPGNNRRNKDWIKDVESNLKDLFTETHIQNYSHWDMENAEIDFNLELQKLETLAKTQNQYAVFAKSAGTILTLKAIYDKKISPEFCVFTGLAYYWAKKQNIDIDKLLTNYSTPTLFIQKTNDPAISYKTLVETLHNNSAQSYESIEIPGDNHHYEDIPEIRELLIGFMDKTI